MLDIVAAARQLDPNISKRYLISGHSQGGHAALFAAGLASSWQPKLKLRGTVAFAPASHILDQTSLLPALTSPSGLTALATLIVDGASTQSSAINVNQILSDPVLQFYPLLQSQCLSRLGASDELGGIAPSQLERSGADLSALNPVLAAMNPLVKTSAPILIPQGEADTTVFPEGEHRCVGLALGDQDRGRGLDERVHRRQHRIERAQIRAGALQLRRRDATELIRCPRRERHWLCSRG